jgi:hypothetical protein
VNGISQEKVSPKPEISKNLESGTPARISHSLSAVAADPGMSTALRSVGRLDILSSAPAEPLVAHLGSMPVCTASLRNLLRKYPTTIQETLGVGFGIGIAIETDSDTDSDPDADKPKQQNIFRHLGATRCMGNW